MNNYVVGMGEALWDVLPEGKKLGGAPANFAYHASQFGLESRVVSAVGDDNLGKEILESFREKKLDGVIETVPYPTGTVQVTLDDAGVPCYDIKEGVACARFLEAMPDTPETLKIFDINLRQHFYTKEILCDSMRRCNVLKINDEELITVSRLFGYPDTDPQDACRMLLNKYNLRMLILTCGVNGSYVFTPGGVSFLETPRVQVADTVGAGDSFTAAFASAILKGKTVSEAHRLAVDTSAFVCTQQGAMPALPDSLRERLASSGPSFR